MEDGKKPEDENEDEIDGRKSKRKTRGFERRQE